MRLQIDYRLSGNIRAVRLECQRRSNYGAQFRLGRIERQRSSATAKHLCTNIFQRSIERHDEHVGVQTAARERHSLHRTHGR